jgi:hypothetical protein
VELPITNHYPIIEHFFKSLSFMLHFEGFKMLLLTLIFKSIIHQDPTKNRFLIRVEMYKFLKLNQLYFPICKWDIYSTLALA